MKKQKPLKKLELNGKEVLITGGLGFIGSNMVHRCLELGAKVTVFDCLDPRSGGNLHNVEGIRDRIELCFHNILDFDQVSERVVGKDLIFNCAASTSHPFSMKEPWIDMDVNSRGVINLLEAVRRFNPGARFVHVGTTTQLGKLLHQPADESHPEFPMDIYSANKSVSEKYVLIYSNAYSLACSVVRLSNTYGPRASIHSADFTFNNYFIGLALQDKDICVFGDGRQLRNVLFVDDAVDALVMVAKSSSTLGRTMFAVGDIHHSVVEIAHTTVDVIGKGRVRMVPWPPGRRSVDVGDAVISNAWLKSNVGWQPRFDLKSGLARTREFFEKNLDKYLR